MTIRSKDEQSARSANVVAPRQSGRFGRLEGVQNGPIVAGARSATATSGAATRSGANSPRPVATPTIRMISPLMIDSAELVTELPLRGPALFAELVRLMGDAQFESVPVDLRKEGLGVVELKRMDQGFGITGADRFQLTLTRDRALLRLRAPDVWTRGSTAVIKGLLPQLSQYLDGPYGTYLDNWHVKRVDMAVDFEGFPLTQSMSDRFSGGAGVRMHIQGGVVGSFQIGGRKSRRSLSIQDKSADLTRRQAYRRAFYEPVWMANGYAGGQVTRVEARIHGADYAVGGVQLNLRSVSTLLDNDALEAVWGKAVADYRLLARRGRPGEKTTRIPTDPYWTQVMEAFEYSVPPTSLRQSRAPMLMREDRLKRSQDRVLRSTVEAIVLCGDEPTMETDALVEAARVAIEAAKPRARPGLVERMKAKHAFVIAELDEIE